MAAGRSSPHAKGKAGILDQLDDAVPDRGQLLVGGPRRFAPMAKFGLIQRLSNPHRRPLECIAAASMARNGLR
jgi:hypothetical protein